jgi:hypothetical protein
MSDRLKILRSEIGCPTEPGIYEYQRDPIRVMRTHSEAAEQNANAIWVVVRIRPFIGRISYALSSIVPERENVPMAS